MSKPSPVAVELVSTTERSRDIVERIIADAEASSNAAETKKRKNDYAIAVDLEGRRIGPAEGVLALISVGTPDGKVYLFDIAAMKETAFTEGLLQPLLENPTVTKIWFDCRTDVAELHKYHVFPKRVLDLQVSAVYAFCPSGTLLIGLAKTLEKLRLSSPRDDIAKKAGQKLFIPELGGSYDVWFQRPLMPEMVEYASVDVKHLFAARGLLKGHEERCLDISSARVAKWCRDNMKHGDHMKNRDF